MRDARRPWTLANAAFIAAAILVAVAGLLQAEEAHAAQEARANVLLVASDPGQVSTTRLADYLSDAFDVEITTIGPDEYAPLIDAEAFDGFVYLGNDYYKPPGAGFLADMAATDKSVLWVNYHAWLLPQALQDELGMRFGDVHSLNYTKADFFGMRPLTPTDTSLVEVEFPARTLFWLYSDDLSLSLPGSAASGRFVHVSYLPALLVDQPDFAPFREAAEVSFSQISAPADPVPDAAERLEAMRGDTYRTAVHLPFVASDGQVDLPPAYDSDALHDNLLRIRDIGAETVILTQTFFQVGTTGSEPKAVPFATAAFDALENIVEDAHKLGLSVRLAIVVNLAEEGRNPGDWRGFIRPGDPERWWDTYRGIVLDAARFARVNDIEALTIGVELSSLEPDEAEWRSLIDAVRRDAGYEHLVGYQVNFDKVTDFTWGDAVDYLAVAAFWPLATRGNEPLESLMVSWDGIGAEIDAWMAENPDVVLEFGEVGYVSQPYAAVYPFSWKPDRSRRLSLEEQETSYLSLEYMLRNSPRIAGVGIFASTEGDLVPDDIGYSPFGKPAEDVVRRLMSLR